jgi:23S rRNA pseudouridine1911/1915/1917 synthase
VPTKSIIWAQQNGFAFVPVLRHFSGLEKLFDIIHEDENLLVVQKPSDLVCHPTKGDEFSSLISRARIYLKTDREPRLVNRLDRETSGLVVIAKSSVVAGELGKIWEARNVQKEYLAIVHGTILAEHEIIDAPLGKDEKSIVAVKDCVRTDGAAARTEFFREKIFALDGKDFSLLRVLPQSGRKHQIRIHLAYRGHPIVGDKLYGGDEDLYLALVQNRLTDEQRAKLIFPNHALHAGKLRFEWRGQEWNFACPPEKWFSDFIGS